MLPAIIIYMVIRSIAKGARAAGEEARREAERGARTGAPADAAAGTSVGAGDLMRELQKVLEESRRVAEGGSRAPMPPRPAPRRKPVTVMPTPRPAPPVRVVVRGEDQRSLEIIPDEAVSLDSEAEAVIARRRAEVDRRNAELAGERHSEFDRRVRSASSTAMRSTARTSARLPVGGLRQAFIWSEVLGKPVGLR